MAGWNKDIQPELVNANTKASEQPAAEKQKMIPLFLNARGNLENATRTLLFHVLCERRTREKFVKAHDLEIAHTKDRPKIVYIIYLRTITTTMRLLALRFLHRGYEEKSREGVNISKIP